MTICKTNLPSWEIEQKNPVNCNEIITDLRFMIVMIAEIIDLGERLFTNESQTKLQELMEEFHNLPDINDYIHDFEIPY
ncbi:hypothetical protein CAEBREN_12177 [Caenorhabditis brenneri]|uniref:Uncharacterized protein n=1 Tax=Caenorhabditis brenneri TaxID=135651 RepID=G0MH76_CAEBE|nr:hypothetical protein CAEBREN_12177 [Caenorhabditis brenneri]